MMTTTPERPTKHAMVPRPVDESVTHAAPNEAVVRALSRLEKFAQSMDAAFTIPIINRKIGWDSILGLIPGVGDAITGTASAAIVLAAMRMGVRKRAIVRMLVNIGLDALCGAIPLVGDLFDIAYKSNLKNVALLRRELERRQT